MKVRGLLLAAIYDFLNSKSENLFLQNFFCKYNQFEKQNYYEDISIILWYPYNLYINLIKSIYSKFGLKSPAIMYEIGAFTAEYTANTSFSMLFKIGTPKYLITIADNAYHTYFSDGKLDILDRKNDKVIMKISELPEINDLNIKIILGWMEGAFRLTGGVNPKTTIIEKNKQEKYVTILGTWEY